jgi:hypothetical protein
MKTIESTEKPSFLLYILEKFVKDFSPSLS